MIRNKLPPVAMLEHVDIITANIEAGIGDLVRKSQPTNHNSGLPLPDYVAHHDDINEAGRLSAQAMAAEHEKAAKSIEHLAEELVNLARRCDEDAMTAVKHNEMVRAKIDAVVGECREAAALYREEAKAIFDQIQTSSLLVDVTHRTLDDLKDRIKTRAVPEGKIIDAQDATPGS